MSITPSSELESYFVLEIQARIVTNTIREKQLEARANVSDSILFRNE